MFFVKGDALTFHSNIANRMKRKEKRSKICVRYKE